MKSLPFFFSSSTANSSNETVEKALDSIVENASKYRELMGSCDPHGLAFGRQLIERKHGDHGEMFQKYHFETGKSLASGMASQQVVLNTSRNGFQSNGFQQSDSSTQFKKPQPVTKSYLESFMLQSKQSAMQENTGASAITGPPFPRNTMPVQQKPTNKAMSIVSDLGQDNKLAEKRKFQEEVTAEFFATHKRLLVAGSSNCEQGSSAPMTSQTMAIKYEKNNTKSNTASEDDFVLNEEFSLSAALFSKQKIHTCPETSIECQQVEGITDSQFEQGTWPEEAPVRNSLFWLYRSFPHLFCPD